MPEWLLGMMGGGAIGVVGGLISGLLRLKAQKEEMRHTRRRDAAAATLELMRMTRVKNKDEVIQFYREMYHELLKTGYVESSLTN